MGYTSYNVSARAMSADTKGYFSKSADQIFTQNVLRKLHESMSPLNMKIRECFDSEAHPLTIPIIFGLDVTGSMKKIPHLMIKDGIPTMMGNLIQRGLNDAAVCFLGIGDHESDSCPIQIGQFESGDAEMDMWCERMYLEGGGGANAGESYQLAWFFASRFTKTDAWTKRGQKGFIFTVGDEPVLPNLPSSAIKQIFGDTNGVEGNITTEQLLKEVQEKYNVYHIVIEHSGKATNSIQGWKNLLGQNCLVLKDQDKISELIAETVLSYKPQVTSSTSSSSEEML